MGQGEDRTLSSVDTARQALLDRLGELQAEEQRLQNALAALDSDGMVAKPGRAAKRKARSSGRAPRGQRKSQFLSLVKANPGMPVAEIAERLQMAPSQAYTLARRLSQAGKIKKQGKGYKVR
jgi:predicted Rossmann fold nucleotide-binding protein DprA/Smf involved in DNA uptake